MFKSLNINIIAETLMAINVSAISQQDYDASIIFKTYYPSL